MEATPRLIHVVGAENTTSGLYGSHTTTILAFRDEWLVGRPGAVESRCLSRFYTDVIHTPANTRSRPPTSPHASRWATTAREPTWRVTRDGRCDHASISRWGLAAQPSAGPRRMARRARRTSLPNTFFPTRVPAKPGEKERGGGLRTCRCGRSGGWDGTKKET